MSASDWRKPPRWIAELDAAEYKATMCARERLFEHLNSWLWSQVERKASTCAPEVNGQDSEAALECGGDNE